MMNRKGRLILQAGVLAFIPILSTLAIQPAEAQFKRVRRGGNPTFVPGEIVLYCQPNTAQADVNALAALVGAAQTTPLLLADAYKLTLAPAQQTAADTVTAVATLKADPRVRWVSPNLISTRFQATTTPNDPRYTDGEQWGLNQINMPEAWTLQKGTANVSDIDTGVDQTIADQTGQFLTDSYNIADNDTDIQAGPTTTAYPDAQHGVGTSGVMIAKANNGVGIASVDGWGTTKCLFLKDASGLTDIGTFADDVNALAYVLSHAKADNVVALNISWAYIGLDPNDTTNMLYTSVLALTNAGVIVCVAAGNENTNDTYTNSPQGYPFVVTVAATGPTAQRAVYSSFGKVDIAAPGGDPTLGGTPDPVTGPTLGATTDSILTTTDGGYHYTQGTSFAAPHATGVVGLLLSVPGVTSQQIFNPNSRATSVLLTTANHTLSGQTTVPDMYYGYGILDAYAALQKVSTTAVIISPVGINPVTGQSSDPNGLTPAPVETLRPTMQFQVSGAPLSNVNIVLQQANGTNLPIITNGAIDPAAAGLVTNAAGQPGFDVTGTTTGTFPLYTISFRYRFNTSLPTQQETVVITAQPTNTAQPVVTDTRVFSLTPHQFQSGLSMVSIPYYESAIDSPAARLRSAQEILGLTTVALYRWVNVSTLSTAGVASVQGQYASNGTTADVNPTLASLQPANVATTLIPDDSVPNHDPIGIGYFLNIPSGALVSTYGQTYPQNLVRIPLQEGWNLVGDPFSFAVSFATCQIETSDGNRQAISDAATANLVLPYIYTYVAGDYQLQQLPNGTLEPWQGHWIYVVPKNPANLSLTSTLNLIVPPSQTTSSSATRAVKRSAIASGPTLNGAGSWGLRLEARAGQLVDTSNYIGMSANATDGNDLTKAPKPPRMSPYVSLGLLRSATTGGLTNGGLYAQDLRPTGKTETWDVVVNTDQKEADITVQWPNISGVSRGYDLTLTDKATGQTYNMRSLAAYKYHATAQAPSHQFTITATPDPSGGRAVISGLLVNTRQTKATGQPVYEINYNLTRAAGVEITVLGTNGRVISLVSPTRAATPGSNYAYWTGRDTSGRALPSGIYTLQVRAQTEDGLVTREVQTLTLTGR